MLADIETYQDLLAVLQKMTPEQLAQPIQVVKDCGDLSKPVELQPAFCIGTVKELEFNAARSSVDNVYHPEEIVIMIDSNPFRQDGVIAHKLVGHGKRESIYSKDGPTPPEKQMAEVKTKDPEHFGKKLKYRCKELRKNFSNGEK